jgi:hypothetical protein
MILIRQALNKVSAVSGAITAAFHIYATYVYPWSSGRELESVNSTEL